MWGEKRDALDRDEARAVLSELGLPPEMLEEALAEIARREEVARLKKRRLMLVFGAFATAAVVLVAVVGYSSAASTKLARITVGDARITTVADTSHVVDKVARGATPDVMLTAQLVNAPQGEEVALSCDWIAPSGKIAHENAWKTKPVDREVWNTHCHYRLPSDAEVGTWKVRMRLAARELVVRPVLVE